MDKPITPNQLKAFNAILTKHGLMDTKAGLVRHLSKGRASSSKDLFSEEVQPWIDAMNKAQPEQEDPRQKMVNSIIAMAREMGVIKRRTVNKNGRLKAESDYAEFKLWMNSKSYLKKELNEYTYGELPKLVSQYKAIFDSWLGQRKKRK